MQNFHTNLLLLVVEFILKALAQPTWDWEQAPWHSSIPEQQPEGTTEPQHLYFDLVARFSTVEYVDGVRKEIITINDRFPGPTLRARLGDKVTVRVRNQLRDISGREHETSVHFHGIEMKETPWWDGPELVTQCPIKHGEHMDYTFMLLQSGTYWWHSHTSWQFIDGYWGFLIVDSNVTEAHRYDDELSISLMDWHHRTGEELTQVFRLPETSSIPNAGRTPVPDSALINGRGNADCNLARSQNLTCNDALSNRATVFTVNPGYTYRIRVLNPSARASFNFSIDGHKLRVIEVDGVDTVQVAPVDVVEIWPAQRYSFLVTMDSRQPVDYFWIRSDMIIEVGILTGEEITRIRSIRPLAALRYRRRYPMQPQPWPCTAPFGVPTGQRYTSVGGGFQGRPACRTMPWEDARMSWAKGRFEKLSASKPSSPEWISPVENQNPTQATVDAACIPDLSRRNPRPVYLNQMDCQPLPSFCEDDTVPENFDHEVTLTARFHTDAFGFRRWSFENTSYNPMAEHVPAIFHVLGPKRVPETFGPRYVPLLQNIQVVINNDNDGAHPYHLHGHTFWVMATGEAGQGNYNPARDAWRLRNATPIKRDTTHALPRSWTVVRFCTDNVGTWLFHCHIHWHLDRGLGTVFIEGNEEASCRYQVPPEARRVCETNGVLVQNGNDECRRQNLDREITHAQPSNGILQASPQVPSHTRQPQNLAPTPFQHPWQSFQNFPNREPF